MKRTMWIVGGVIFVVLLLAGGAFMAGRLLGVGPEAMGLGGRPKIQISTGDGPATEAEWVPAEELPESPPEVTGIYARHEDNSVFVNETEGPGFRITMDEDGSVTTNASDKVSEIVVTGETKVYVDRTLDSIDESLASGVIHQKLKPGTVEEIGELSFVQAWGEMRGDRLIASMVVYHPPPVISR